MLPVRNRVEGGKMMGLTALSPIAQMAMAIARLTLILVPTELAGPLTSHTAGQIHEVSLVQRGTPPMIIPCRRYCLLAGDHHVLTIAGRAMAVGNRRSPKGALATLLAHRLPPFVGDRPSTSAASRSVPALVQGDPVRAVPIRGWPLTLSPGLRHIRLSVDTRQKAKIRTAAE